jgi:type IV secretory pathway TraG/TraD family ATPase VirD4
MTPFDQITQISNVKIYTILFWLLLVTSIIMFPNWKKRHKTTKNQLKTASKTKAHGIIFGKKGLNVIYSPTNQEGHIAVFGGSGLGKTSALLIPTLKSWTGTSFSIDISGDICKNVDIINKLIYEPSNPQSIPYNIFGAIDSLKNEDDQNEALEELAFLLMPDDERMADATKFFNTEGRKILTSALIAFYHTGMDFIPICEKIVGSSWKDLFNAIDSTKYDKAIQYINSFIGTSEQNTAGCKQSADSVLKLFATNERVKRTIRRPYSQEIAFTPSRLEKNNVFVVVDDSKLTLYAPLLHIITAQSLKHFSNRSNDSTTTILFCLDEFASLGKMEITDALRKLRKKHVRIMMLTQSMADIDLIYGRDERMAMMNNFRFKVIMGADDTDTQEYFAKLIGQQNTKKLSKSSNSTQITYTESEVREWIIEPESLARLGNTLILLHPNGHIQLKKNFYYK